MPSTDSVGRRTRMHGRSEAQSDKVALSSLGASLDILVYYCTYTLLSDDVCIHVISHCYARYRTQNTESEIDP